MKLDKDLIEEIYDFVSSFDYKYYATGSKEDIIKYLSTLDLVVKLGDSSQSVLVSNEKKGK